MPTSPRPDDVEEPRWGRLASDAAWGLLGADLMLWLVAVLAVYGYDRRNDGGHPISVVVLLAWGLGLVAHWRFVRGHHPQH